MRSAYTVRYVGPPGWRRIPIVTRVTLVLAVVGYLTFVFAPSFTALLFVSPGLVFPKLQLWRLLTYPFVVSDIIGLLFGLLILWSFGTELESEWGSRSYATFLVLATFTAGLLGTAMAVAVPATAFVVAAGLSSALTSIIFAWMWLGPGRPSNFFGVIPMTRKVFALIALLFVVFSELQTSHSILLSLSTILLIVGGLPVAYLWARRGRGGISMPRFLRRRRFRVVRGEHEGALPRRRGDDEIFH